MDPTRNDGESNEMTVTTSGILQKQPQNVFSEHSLSYLEPITELGDLVPQKTVPHQGGKSSDTGSPPPHSATTSGSTSTPTTPSTGGVSSSADGQMNHPDSNPDFPATNLGDGTSSPSLEPFAHRQQNEGNWPRSASEGAFTQEYPSSSTVLPPPSEEHDPSQSPGDSSSNYSSAIKLLVSNNVAGSIIGRAGETISEMQAQSSARIKLSQTGDYYPGTQDRVCLVQGHLECVKVAVRLLLERLYALQGLQHSQQHSQQLTQQHSQHQSQLSAWQPKPNELSPQVGFDFIVRLLVPSSSCGMIIGKSGSNIKFMEEASGVSSVRLSPKESSGPSSPSGGVVSGTSERIVTLTGQTCESCLACLHMILDGMQAHHEFCRYTNMTTSYSRVVMQGTFGSVPTVPAIPGRPLVLVPSGVSPESPVWESGSPYTHFGVDKRSSSSPDLVGQILWDHRAAHQMPQENPTTSMARPPSSREPPMQPFNPVFTESPQPYPHDNMAPMMSSPPRGPGGTNLAAVYLLQHSHLNQMDHSVSAPDLLALRLQDSSLRMDSALASSAVDHSQFAPQLPQPTPTGFTAQLLLPDAMIGSILGRGGRTLNELQMHSNTRIRISQRGEYYPGTRDRVVTIRGPTAQSVSVAQYLMSQRMVRPPTAVYSPQSPFHPTPPVEQTQLLRLQLPPQYPSLQPQQAHRQDFYPTQYHGTPVENAFQGSEKHGRNSPSGSSYRGVSSNKELSPHS